MHFLITGDVTEKEHKNEEFLKKRNLTLNDSKTIRNVTILNTLYFVGNGIIKTDPEGMKPLQEIQLPKDMRTLNRARGIFVYYVKWIPDCSDKIHPLKLIGSH